MRSDLSNPPNPGGQWITVLIGVPCLAMSRSRRRLYIRLMMLCDWKSSIQNGLLMKLDRQLRALVCAIACSGIFQSAMP